MEIIEPELGDYVRLTSGEIIEITNEKPLKGFNVITNEQIDTLVLDNIVGIKKFGVEPRTSTDSDNYWIFDVGPGYPNTTRKSIMQYALFELPEYFGEMNESEIMWKHIFYISKSMTQEDAFVLFVNKHYLPEDLYELASEENI